MSRSIQIGEVYKMEYKIPPAPAIKKCTEAPDQRKFAVIPLDVIKKPGITFAALKVLIAFSSYCNKSGSSYVSQNKLAQDLKVSRQAVQKQIKKLVDLGLIKEYKNYYPNLKGSTRRIIYDHKLEDDQIQAVANEPIERINNRDINARLINKRISKLDDQKQPQEVAQSSEDDNQLIASLFSCVSKESELLQLERLININMDKRQILQHYQEKGTLPPLPPGL